MEDEIESSQGRVANYVQSILLYALVTLPSHEARSMKRGTEAENDEGKDSVARVVSLISRVQSMIGTGRSKCRDLDCICDGGVQVRRRRQVM